MTTIKSNPVIIFFSPFLFLFNLEVFTFLKPLLSVGCVIIQCIHFVLFDKKKPLLLSLKNHCKSYLFLYFVCFLFSIPLPPSLVLFLSLVAGLFLLSPAMMAPHLTVGTMRNDKMGEPCFYLMGQNQTTVCSQKCPNPPCFSPLAFCLSLWHPQYFLLHLPLLLIPTCIRLRVYMVVYKPLHYTCGMSCHP